MNSSTPVFLRWVTWYPAPYFNARFVALASHPAVNFRAYFLSRASPIHEWDLPEDLFEFDHEYVPTLLPNRFPQGQRRKGFPFWAFRERNAALVLPYAETELMLAILGRKLLGARTFAFQANTMVDTRSWSRSNEWAKHLAMKSVNGLLATGPWQREYAQHYTDDASKITVIGNPVDNDWYLDRHRELQAIRSELRAKLGLTGLAVLYVGRLSAEKDVRVLIEAFSQMHATTSNAHLLLAGDGSETQSLRIQASEGGADVRFLGFTERDKLSQLFEASDVLVLPSRSEPWGLVVNEAMLFEKPVIVSDRIGAAPCLVQENVNGYVFPVGRADLLAQRLEYLAQNPSAVRSMGERSLEIVQNHHIGRWVEAVLSAVSE
jgi:glycosyltransferase involved in cell wall biosynthesis